MPASKIMIIRHAEKPDENISSSEQPLGVTEVGKQDAESLIVRGWQRAGALVRLFVPRHGTATAPLPEPGLAVPNLLIASGIGNHSNSRRPQETISAIAAALQGRASTNFSFLKGDEQAMAATAVAFDGVVLICWEHQNIPLIAKAIMGGAAGVPTAWPGDRFDVVWVFDRLSATQGWAFSQVPQLLLPGDQPT